MAWPGRREYGIGRGEVAESHIEAPIFALIAVMCAAALFVVHFQFKNDNVTIALAISLLVFGMTLVRVEYGLFILLVAMLLSPEIEAGSVGAKEERAVNLRYDDILIIIIFLGVVVKHAFEGRPLLWRPNPINPGIFIYYGLCLVSTLLALRISVPAWDRDVAFFVLLKMLEFYLIFFMVGMSVTSMKGIEDQLKVFFAVSLIVCVYGIISIGTLPRVSAPFEAGGTEPNTLGGYLLIVICLCMAMRLYAPTSRWKWTFFAIASAAFVPFIMTLSRASYIALFVALVAMGAASRRLSVVALVAVVLIASPFVMPDDVITRVNDTFLPSGVPINVPGVQGEVTIDKSAYERIYVWKKARYNLRIWPWFGGGISWDTVLDSQFARVIIETGLLGFAAFIFLLWRVLRTTHEAFRWSRYWVAKGLSLGMFATCIGLIAHGFGTISFLIVRIMEPFWFLVALTCVAREIAILDHGIRLKAYQEEQHERQLGQAAGQLRDGRGIRAST
ncbi:MAG: hypothetical protein IID09_01720 [Candidatus Hydrogenedentes bacterium]|nr:hypothetical protein [Candidatus Hydrogenedentota bacterium]